MLQQRIRAGAEVAADTNLPGMVCTGRDSALGQCSEKTVGGGGRERQRAKRIGPRTFQTSDDGLPSHCLDGH